MMGAFVLITGYLAPQAAAQNMPAPAEGADGYTAAVATEWFALSFKLVQQTPGYSPPVASRALAYLGLALYESTTPGVPGRQSLAGQLSELDSLPLAQPDEPLHWPTVANAAMATMTRMMFRQASAENKARIDLLERELPVRHGRDFDPIFVTAEIGNRSQTFGRLMAMAILTWARTDGGHEAWGPLRRSQSIYVPPSGPGQWTPTPPAYQSALLPGWGKVRNFAPANATDCGLPPPPSYSEAMESPFHAEAAEVHRISTQATQEQRQFALYWADDPGKTPTPAGHWAYIATDLLKGRKATLAQAAEVYATLNLAMADAFIAAWRTKYEINLLRPVTYIQQAFDRLWIPPLMDTPPFPEFPSGHSVQSSAAAQVLEQAFGADFAFVDNTHNDRGWGPRHFASFRAAADEAAMSRLYAGIHFRSGVEAGIVQGRCVARNILALKIRP